jgi:ankyrin repeat protein
MNLLPPLPPPQSDDPIITQFKPVKGQWELNDENIKRIDPKTGQTILHNYCQRINTTPLEVYRYLIEVKGCDVNAQDNNQDTPLRNAFRCFDPGNSGTITALTYLINEKNVDVNIKDRNGTTLLHRACEKINALPIEIFKVLIETHGADVNVQDNCNDTPLHNAIGYSNIRNSRDIAVLLYLFSQTKVNVNIKGQFGKTLLHVACQRINILPLVIFELLIETYRCDVNVQAKYNDTPLHYALQFFNPNHGGDLTVLTYLLSRKDVNANIKDEYGNTLLHTACDNINKLPLEIFKVLIETHGADVNAKDNDKNTPIHHALRFINPNNGGDIKVLYYFLAQKDVNVNIQSEFGNTLLHYACLNMKTLPLEIFELLIETHGADVNVQAIGKNTPLHNVLRQFDPNNGDDITILTYLLGQKGVHVNIKDKKGYTLLHLACICDISESKRFVKLNAECDTILSQIVEFIAERCMQEVFDEKLSLEATTTM